MIIKNLNNCLATETTVIKSCFKKLEKSTKQIIFVVDVWALWDGVRRLDEKPNSWGQYGFKNDSDQKASKGLMVCAEDISY